MKRLLSLAIVAALVLAACGGDSPTPFAVVASSNGAIGTGEQRVLFALIDRETN